MDGGRLRKLWLSGCLIVGALGCNRNAVQQPWQQLPATVTNIPSSNSTAFWGSSGNKSAMAATPTEIVEEPIRKGPARPETYAALADAQVDAAFDEKTLPASREELLDQARQGYQKALQLDPKNKPALLGLGKYYVRLGEREKAIDTYKKYLKAYPKDKEVAHEVAKAHAHWKDWAGAVSWCEYALKIDPENLTVRKTMAFCLARAGQWERGFEVMCEIMPEAQARYLMARVLEHQNQIDASRMQLQLAIKADPTYAPARDFLAEIDQVNGHGPGGVPHQNPILTTGGTEPYQP